MFKKGPLDGGWKTVDTRIQIPEMKAKRVLFVELMEVVDPSMEYGGPISYFSVTSRPKHYLQGNAFEIV